MKNISKINDLDLFEVEELETRFELKSWITVHVYEPCDCDGDGCDDNEPAPECGTESN